MIPEDIDAAELTREEKELFRELDKGIDDFEAGRLTPHDEAMLEIREAIEAYNV